MKLDEFRNAIAAYIRSMMPNLGECRPHPGRFDLEELKRVSAKTPAVYVACLGVSGATDAGGDDAMVDAGLAMAIYVVTTDRQGLPRDVAVLNIVEALSLALVGNRFGVADVGVPSEIKGQNLYAGNVDRIGVAMWGLSWKQSVRLKAESSEFGDTENPVLPTEIYAGFTPDVGIGNESDYVQVNG